MCAAGEPGAGVEAFSGTAAASASLSAVLTARSREGLPLPLGRAAVLRSRLPPVPDLEALRVCVASGEAGVAKTSCMLHAHIQALRRK